MNNKDNVKFQVVEEEEDHTVQDEDSTSFARGQQAGPLKSYHYVALLIIFLFICLFGVFLIIKLNNGTTQPLSPIDNSGHEQEQEKVVLKPTFNLSTLCNNTKWTPNLYLNCTNLYNLPGNPPGTANNQGTVNLRNSIITCLRWAIDAGAGFVIPRIAIRSTYDNFLFDEWRNFTYLFDQEHLLEVMNQDCPQLKIVDYDFPYELRIATRPDLYQNFTEGMYRKRAFDLLAFKLYDPNLNVTVIWDESLFGWNFHGDSKPVHMSLIDAVQYNRTLRSIAAALADKLLYKHIAMHLRWESDMQVISYRAQVDYLIYLLKNELQDYKTVYVSIGDREVEKQFRDEMETININVESKWTLALRDKMILDDLNTLRFDQLGVIDYEIAMRSTIFLGIGISSFSYGLAFQRGNGELVDCRCRILGEFNYIFVSCF
ncbi:MAG: hypothetical protein EOP34_04735 [Rickettsiales bacterium]|nr:MAG: hypothetical protein EOP34_04735 [Rickettsiales bacterium]